MRATSFTLTYKAVAITLRRESNKSKSSAEVKSFTQLQSLREVQIWLNPLPLRFRLNVLFSVTSESYILSVIEWELMV